MRLINTRTLNLQQFLGRPPPYAILSHTWTKHEISLQDFHPGLLRQGKTAYSKIEATCKKAREQGLEYAWIDTCCIDKTSSSELGEAINSMFNWYQNVEICYAFLDDFQRHRLEDDKSNTSQLGFGHCRWFTRGWTLQELIAPKVVEFYDRDWHKIAEKDKYATELQIITGIDQSILKGGPLHEVSIGKRMSWAAGRETSREEDIAYSLLGIFDVNMPLIYGEGSKAFLRLQEQILNRSADNTIFAWRASSFSTTENPVRGLLATSPNEFRNFSDKPQDGIIKDNLIPVWDSQFPRNPITMNNKGIQISSRVLDLRSSWAPGDLLVLVLNCGFGGDTERAAGIYLQRQAEDRYARIRADELVDISPEGRHISFRTLHGLPTMTDIDRLPYDPPWTTMYKLRRDMEDDSTLKHTLRSIKSLYSYAFFMDSRSLNTKTLFGQYSVRGVIIAGEGRTMDSFRYRFHERRQELILRTRSRLKAAIILTPSEYTDTVLIILSSEVLFPNQASSLTWIHSFDVICLSRAQLESDKKLLSNILHNTNCGHGLNSEKSILVSNKRLRLRVGLKPVTIEGLLMERIYIHGPWPASHQEWWRILLSNVRKGLLALTATASYFTFAYFVGPGVREIVYSNIHF